MFQDGSFKTISSALLQWHAADGVPALQQSARCPYRHHHNRTSTSRSQSTSTVSAAVYKMPIRGQCHLSQTLSSRHNWSLTQTRHECRHGMQLALNHATAQLATANCTANTGLNRFPFNNFTHYLTPFSRCFSSFPHGTCSLSVSCHYLALDEIYHPFWAAFPNNSTLRRRLILHGHQCPDGILTLSDALFQGTCAPARATIAPL